MVELNFPWPPAALSPNSRSRTWHKKAAATKAYRRTCAWEAAAQGLRRVDADKLYVRYLFLPPDHRRRDRDGMIAQMKAGQDGLADVLGVDDSRWVTTYEIGDPVPGGLVVIEISLP